LPDLSLHDSSRTRERPDAKPDNSLQMEAERFGISDNAVTSFPAEKR